MPIEYHYLNETDVNIMTVIDLNTVLENVRDFKKEDETFILPNKNCFISIEAELRCSYINQLILKLTFHSTVTKNSVFHALFES